eukprot:scaffold1.g5671.t1
MHANMCQVALYCPMEQLMLSNDHLQVAKLLFCADLSVEEELLLARMAGALAREPGAEHTIYVSNIYEKARDRCYLKKCMRAIFGQFGAIADVVSRRTYRLRGQAWVVFEKPEEAARAVDSMQGFPFFEKPLKIALAKTKSDAVAKMDGTFSEERKTARQILFVEEIPESANEAMLSMLFQQFTGFKEVRLVPQRPGIAFVEYEDEVQSSVAAQGLQGFKLSNDKAIKITFAKQ